MRRIDKQKRHTLRYAITDRYWFPDLEILNGKIRHKTIMQVADADNQLI